MLLTTTRHLATRFATKPVSEYAADSSVQVFQPASSDISPRALFSNAMRPTTAPAETLQLRPCPAEPFAVIGTDLYGTLPAIPDDSPEIVTAVYHLTRYTRIASVRTGTTSKVVVFFLQAIYLCRGAPLTLLSEREKAFLSNTLDEVLRVCNAVHKTTSRYHPQTNGLTQ